MSQEVYKELLQIMQKRGGGYAGIDIPEFFEMVEELFTPEQARVNNALPRKPATAEQVAETMDGDKAEIEKTLESMADNGLCRAYTQNGTVYYHASPFMPGILEFQFMPGGTTERDKKVARLIESYEKAFEAVRPPAGQKMTFAGMRVITVDRTIDAGSTVHTYDQVQTFIDQNDTIAVTECFCRHKAILLDEDIHGMPNGVCMSFGSGAESNIERLNGRKLTKEEARKVIDQAEEAGLVHMSRNLTEGISFMCNCDRWHCGAITSMLAQPKPGLFFNSGFEPSFDPDVCTACETCLDRCPAAALVMGDEDVPVVDLDRCFGCAACATGCPSETITMVSKPGFPEPPANTDALREAFQASRK